MAEKEKKVLSAVNYSTFEKAVFVLLGVVLVSGAIIGAVGYFTKGWLWIEALGPDLAIVAAFALVFMFKAKQKVATWYVLFIGSLIALSYPIMAINQLFESGATFIYSLQASLEKLTPHVILVQNTGQYDPQKYGISEYVSSLPWLFGIVVILTALSYLNIRIASKKIQLPFHGMMLFVAAVITWVFVSSIRQVDAQASLAVLILFSIGAIFAGYWSTILDLFIFPLLGWEYTSDKVGQFFINAALSCIKLAQVLTPVLILASMVWFVSVTSLTITIGFKALTLGMIEGAVLSGALREFFAIGRLYKKAGKSAYIDPATVLDK